MRDLVGLLRTEAAEMRQREVFPSGVEWTGLHAAMVLIAERYDQAADEIERLREPQKASEGGHE